MTGHWLSLCEIPQVEKSPELYYVSTKVIICRLSPMKTKCACSNVAEIWVSMACFGLSQKRKALLIVEVWKYVYVQFVDFVSRDIC
jgi:hypothetical protein